MHPIVKKTNKTKLLILICILASILGVSIYGVAAYLASASDTVENVFSADNITINLAETDTEDGDDNPNTNTYEMVPGKEIYKDPKITVPKDTADCWIYVKLEKSKDFDEYLTYQVTEGWENLGDKYPGIYYMKVAKVKDSEQTFIVLKDNKVELIEDVDEEAINSMEVPPTLTITAYSVQQATFKDALTAWESVFNKDKSDEE